MSRWRMLALAVLVLPQLAPTRPGSGSLAGGAIEGEVAIRLRPARRSAERYPGAAGPAHTVQAVPAVAYLVGALPGPASIQPRVMSQRDTAFVPSALVVQKGTVVRFPNEDPFFHNVFSYSPNQRFDLGRYPRGEAKAVTFDSPGVVKIYCEVHEFMRSVVVVTENPYHATVAPDGRFRIEGVPAGTHTLVVWHPDLEPVEARVVVTEGGTARVRLELR